MAAAQCARKYNVGPPQESAGGFPLEVERKRGGERQGEEEKCLWKRRRRGISRNKEILVCPREEAEEKASRGRCRKGANPIALVSHLRTLRQVQLF